MTETKQAPVEPTNAELAARLKELVRATAEGDWREFYMSIPAQPHHDADIVMSIAAERLAAAPATEPSEVEQLRQRVAELERRNLDVSMLASKWMEAHDKLKAGVPYKFPEPADLPESEKRAEAAEAQLTALPKWAQSSESKGQFYRKSVQEMAALREQMAALREENLYLKEIYIDLGLHDSACRIDRDGECDCWHERFSAELQSLLTQTAPDVNSGGVVERGVV